MGGRDAFVEVVRSNTPLEAAFSHTEASHAICRRLSHPNLQSVQTAKPAGDRRRRRRTGQYENAIEYEIAGLSKFMTIYTYCIPDAVGVRSAQATQGRSTSRHILITCIARSRRKLSSHLSLLLSLLPSPPSSFFLCTSFPISLSVSSLILVFSSLSFWVIWFKFFLIF